MPLGQTGLRVAEKWDIKEATSNVRSLGEVEDRRNRVRKLE